MATLTSDVVNLKIALLLDSLLCVSTVVVREPAWWTSPVAQLVKNLPAMQETPVQFLGWEDPLKKR